MASKSIFCLASSRWQADDIVTRLKAAGFADKDISVLFADKKDSSEFAKERHTSTPDTTKGAEGTATGVGAGGVVGGTLGLLAGIGSLVIPGVGPFLAVGPIMATIGGAAVGATVGGIAGGLIGLGIPEINARHYETKVKDGYILISVHADKWEDIHRARRVFNEASASDIATSGEVEAEEKNKDKVKDANVPYQPYTGRERKADPPPYVPLS